MSLRALTWAVENRDCPSPQAKLVLIVFANYANDRGWSYPSSETLQRVSGLNIKTVRAAVDALEEAGLIADTGKRAGKTQQVKVYQLRPESLPKTGAFDGNERHDGHQDGKEGHQGALPERHPETDAFKAPVSGSKGTQKREAEPVLGTLPPGDADASPAPRGAGRDRGSKIPVVWVAPAIHELPPQARSIAAQWPAGAYEVEAEAFHNYWLGEGRAGSRKHDWKRAWCNRVVSLGSKPIREQKAGLRFDPPAAGVEMTREDRAAAFERIAAGYDKLGQHDRAAEQRRIAELVRGGAQTGIACQTAGSA